MPLPLIPLFIGSLLVGGGAAAHRHIKRRAFTPQRKQIYETAMQSCRDPVKLRQLAESFRSQGLTAQAKMLEKRAALREVPKDMAEARKVVFKAALQSKDPAAVLKVAQAHEQVGALGAAQRLRDYAQTLLVGPENGHPGTHEKVEQ